MRFVDSGKFDAHSMAPSVQVISFVLFISMLHYFLSLFFCSINFLLCCFFYARFVYLPTEITIQLSLFFARFVFFFSFFVQILVDF